jgi:microcystin-dependent protein
MSQSFVGEIRIFAGTFEPSGWVFCDGRLLPISEYETLFQLIGTTYGGDGQSTFALPDLRSRIPIHWGTDPASGTTFQIGEMGGVESVTLTANQIPAHTHPLSASTNNAATANASGNVLAQTPSYTPYISGVVPNSPLNASTITPVGGGQAHDNFQPYLCVNFILSLFGVFPSPT